MGLLDSVLGSVLGGAGGQGGGGGNAQLLQVVLGMLGNDSAAGGLGGLLQKAQQAGLGDVVSSWVGTGQNQPISGDQLGGLLNSVLGQGQVANMAQQMGVDQGDLLGQLSQMLPQVVDKLTPQGQVPEGGLGNIGDLLGQLQGGGAGGAGGGLGDLLGMLGKR
ncbi:hypothetical protein BurJ1DRAFT_0819 [Burkholderiales bacterium JOSHI_001]|nr:hypothetical protein BurJ1DRAFT_0819 [Burkholderiales bacterium JOSHI_001]